MLALLFEVTPKHGHETLYLERARALRPLVDANPGLLFLERYRSLSRPATILSHSLWRDEDALGDWRRNGSHKTAQRDGRRVHFEDYRIRIAEVLAGDPAGSVKGLSDGGKTILISRGTGSGEGADGELFQSLVTDDGVILVENLEPDTGLPPEGGATAAVDVKVCRVIRDYGMTRRDEAPAELRRDNG